MACEDDELMRVCEILFPLPFEKPEMVPEVCIAVQVKVVPGTVPDKAIFVVAPVQIICEVGEAVTTGVGFTVTGVVKEAVQLFASETETL